MKKSITTKEWGIFYHPSNAPLTAGHKAEKRRLVGYVVYRLATQYYYLGRGETFLGYNANNAQKVCPGTVLFELDMV